MMLALDLAAVYIEYKPNTVTVAENSPEQYQNANAALELTTLSLNRTHTQMRFLIMKHNGL